MMRAKMIVKDVIKNSDNSVRLIMGAVYKNKYDETGEDEDNTFAKFTPSADLNMLIQNHNLVDKFKIGQKFYLDFMLIEG